jgi:3-methyladenine DNA glycosylase AlkD
MKLLNLFYITNFYFKMKNMAYSNIKTTEIIEIFKENYNEYNIKGMARFGIDTTNAFGLSMPQIKSIAKKIGRNHNLALDLLETGYHESKLLAVYIAEPKKISSDELDNWVSKITSWDECDQFCSNLAGMSPHYLEKIYQWTDEKEEFVLRAGIVLMAVVAYKKKKEISDEYVLENFNSILISHSTDQRNFVKKAVNWAIRQLGKRSEFLRLEMIKLCEVILELHSNSAPARWIAKGALRELKDEKIISRIKLQKIE